MDDMPMRDLPRRGLPRRGVLAGLAVLVLAAGCGLPADERPHVVGASDLPLPLPTQRTAPSAPGRPAPAITTRPLHVSVPARVYYVRERKVVAVPTIIRTESGDPEGLAADLLAQLKSGPSPDPAQKSLTSRLTGDSRVKLLSVEAGTAVIELGPAPDGASETRDGLWTAQVVMTMTSVNGIVRVRFQGVDGRQVRVVLPNGQLVDADITAAQVSAAVG